MEWIGTGKAPTVAVLGLGYVGLPLLLQFNRSGNRVIGLDIDEEKIKAINAGRSYIQHIQSKEIQDGLKLGNLSATADFSRIKDADAAIICVPTPLTRNREPDIGYILSTGRQIAPHLKKGHLIVLESTTYPGTTDTDLRKVLEQISGLTAGKDFLLAFSPEREDPGNSKYKTADIPKVVGGLTPDCLKGALELYSRAGIKTVAVSSTGTAEATKLMENIFRSVNIALVNELKVVFERMGIDIWEVVEAAKTKPFGYMPFYPGPGLGGHCIPIDPFYLTWKAREYGLSTRFIELAGEINTSMPRYVVAMLQNALSDRGVAMKNARILLLGVAYKKDVDDMRESPSFVLWELMEERGATVSFHDPHVPVIPRTREHPQFANRKSTQLTPEVLRQADAIVIATDHSAVDYQMVVENSKLVVDTRNVCSGTSNNRISAKVVKA